MFIGYEWQDLYREACLETDWTKVEERIDAADAAINRKRQKFELDHGGTPEENQAIEDAMNALNVLRREVADWQENAGQAEPNALFPDPKSRDLATIIAKYEGP